MEIAARKSGQVAAMSHLGELYREQSGRVRHLAYLLSGNWAVAEDLVQDAFVRVAGRFGHLRDLAAFESYLRRTVVHLHASRLRRLRLEAVYAQREGTLPQIEAAVPDVDLRHDLHQALQQLPARQRCAVVLRYCLDYPMAEVAEALGCSVPAARNLVLRGIDSLRTRKEVMVRE